MPRLKTSRLPADEAATNAEIDELDRQDAEHAAAVEKNAARRRELLLHLGELVRRATRGGGAPQQPEPVIQVVEQRNPPRPTQPKPATSKSLPKQGAQQGEQLLRFVRDNAGASLETMAKHLYGRSDDGLKASVSRLLNRLRHAQKVTNSAGRWEEKK